MLHPVHIPSGSLDHISGLLVCLHAAKPSSLLGSVCWSPSFSTHPLQRRFPGHGNHTSFTTPSQEHRSHPETFLFLSSHLVIWGSFLQLWFYEIFCQHSLGILWDLLHMKTYFFLTSLLKYNCFTMVCYFLFYNKVNQVYLYICSHISPLLDRKSVV